MPHQPARTRSIELGAALAGLDRAIAGASLQDLAGIGQAIAARQAALGLRMVELAAKAPADPIETAIEISEAAKRLNISEDWIYRNGKAKGIPFVRAGKHLRVSERGLNRWIRKQAESHG